MVELLQTIAAYVPPNIVRTVLADKAPAPPRKATAEYFSAAVLFADISGFTPLTEALAQKGAEGPEELTRLLNRYFSWMIAFIEQAGGEVVKFGGDALIVVFPALDEDVGPAIRHAMQAASTMQSVMDEFSVMESSVGLVTLAMKIGIGAGKVLAAQVGGLYDRWEYIIAGDPIRQVAQAERQAQRGEIILSPEAESLKAPLPGALHSMPPPNWDSVQNPAAAEKMLRCYVPAPVLAWLDEELHGWLASLRPMSVLFVGVDGLDYAQTDTVEKLHAFVREVQKIIHYYQGSMPRLTVDDKGTVFLLLFGAPPDAHEDDPERAVRCALDLQVLAQDHQLQLSIGVTTGRVFAGPVGSNNRREYTVMGDTVNLAARLMTIAGSGQINCNYETYRSTQGYIEFDILQPVAVKGKTGLVRLYRPLNNHRLAHGTLPEKNSVAGYLVRGQAEIKKMAAALDAAQSGQSRVVLIEGEAGIGKTRLVAVWLKSVSKQGLVPLVGRGRSIEQKTPYHAWHDIFYSYLQHTFPQLDPAAVPSQQILDLFAEKVPPELSAYLPLLNDVLPINLPDSTATAALDQTQRQINLALLLMALLKRWANEQMLILVFQDAHWLDAASWELMTQLVRVLVAEQLPVLLVVVMRPLEEGAARVGSLTLQGMTETEHIRLDALPPEETLTIAAARLGLTAPELPEALAELIQRRAGGNPLFAEELTQALLDNGFITLKTTQSADGTAGRTRCLISDDLDRADQILPTIIQSTVLSRIDQLLPEQQLLLRIAAVIGHTFAYITLRDTLRAHLDIEAKSLQTLLADLVYLNLIQVATPEPNLTYAFTYTVIQEVTYQSLPFDRRRKLHRAVAEWYEHAYGHQPDAAPPSPSIFVNHPDPLSPYYPLLVYHWHQAENAAREQHYAALLGQQAVTEFANDRALGYLDRALELTAETDWPNRFTLLLARETVHDRRGRREAQQEDLAALAESARHMDDAACQTTVAFRQSNFARLTGNYTAALSLAQQAAEQAQQRQDTALEARASMAWGQVLCSQSNYHAAGQILAQGLVLARQVKDYSSQAYGLWSLGLVHLRQGDYATAQMFAQQALQNCRDHDCRLHEIESLIVLGQIQYQLGNYAAAQDYFEQAMCIACTVGDQRSELKVYYNIGLIYLGRNRYEAARDYFEHVLAISREIADQEMVGNVLGYLGMVYCYWGDYKTARSYQSQSLDIREDIASEVGQANAFVNFGIIFYRLGDNRTTCRYSERALAIQQKIEDRLGECYSLMYQGHAQTNLGKHQEAESAYRRALHICEQLGQRGLTVDIWAGLARAALAQNEISQALTYVNEILTRFDPDPLPGIDNLAEVYLTLYRVLSASPQDSAELKQRAYSILETAYTNLQNQANEFSRNILKRQFLAIKIHQKIIAAWEEARGFDDA